MTLDERLAALTREGLVCPDCGSATGLRIVLMDRGPHYAKVICDDCRERFVTWVGKPDKPKAKRDGRSKELLAIIRADREGEPLYCEVCLRDERDLPAGAWMEAHHVLEYQDGGSDSPRNLTPVCNECHQLIHWRRRTVLGGSALVGKEREHVLTSG
jgi:hypothetical protein